MAFITDCLTTLGKVRLAKWFQTLPAKTKNKIVKDVTQLVLARRTRMCNFLEYKGEQAIDSSRNSMPLLGPCTSSSMSCDGVEMRR